MLEFVIYYVVIPFGIGIAIGMLGAKFLQLFKKH